MGMLCQNAGKDQRSKSTISAVTRGPTGSRTFEGVEPMGRGRAKAKQVRVARQLKYSGGGTDLDRLRAELGVSTDDREQDGQSAYDGLGDYSVNDEDEDDESFDDDEDDPEVDTVGDYHSGGNGNGSAPDRMSRAAGT